jgi:hypothetical protein
VVPDVNIGHEAHAGGGGDGRGAHARRACRAAAGATELG